MKSRAKDYTIEEIKELATQGAMVNLHWQAQIADLKVRLMVNLLLVRISNAWYTLGVKHIHMIFID